MAIPLKNKTTSEISFSLSKTFEKNTKDEVKQGIFRCDTLYRRHRKGKFDSISNKLHLTN